jgi:hypothetical protein
LIRRSESKDLALTVEIYPARFSAWYLYGSHT